MCWFERQRKSFTLPEEQLLTVVFCAKKQEVCVKHLCYKLRKLSLNQSTRVVQLLAEVASLCIEPPRSCFEGVITKFQFWHLDIFQILKNEQSEPVSSRTTESLPLVNSEPSNHDEILGKMYIRHCELDNVSAVFSRNFLVANNCDF